MNKIIIIIPLVAAIMIVFLPFLFTLDNQLMVITSDSMLPVLKVNDLIIVKPSSIEEIKEGDIITFESHMEFGIVAHRAVEVYEKNDEIMIKTKGDYNPKKDPWTVSDSDLIGKVTDTIPIIGILLVGPVRYLLVAVIIFTSIFLLREIMTEHK